MAGYYFKRYRGYAVETFLRTEGWAWRWTDEWWRRANTNGFADGQRVAMDRACKEVDAEYAREAADVERGLARMG